MIILIYISFLFYEILLYITLFSGNPSNICGKKSANYYVKDYYKTQMILRIKTSCMELISNMVPVPVKRLEL
jgi:hypothetical protein